jgi:hypothetical protein
VCVWNFYLEQRRGLKSECVLGFWFGTIKGFEERLCIVAKVGNFGLKQDHNRMWSYVWNNKPCYNNTTKLESLKWVFFIIFFPFIFFFFSIFCVF